MRLVHQFKRAYKRSDKLVLVAIVKFIGQLVNFRVANEILALQLLTLLLEKPTDDSVEVAVGFMREVGAFLQVMIVQFMKRRSHLELRMLFLKDLDQYCIKVK
jgi:hypothetical protein